MRAATVVQVLQDFEAPPTIAPRPPTTNANSHIDRFLGSKETHIQSHNLVTRRNTTAQPLPTPRTTLVVTVPADKLSQVNGRRRLSNTGA